MAGEDKLFLSDLVQEDDFKTVRHHDWFKSLIDRVKEKEVSCVIVAL
jgi:hypothetical protein